MTIKEQRVKQAVNNLCAAIDAGEAPPTEDEMFVAALVVNRFTTEPLRSELIIELASRCRIGRLALKDMAQ